MLFIQCIWNDLKEISNYAFGGIVSGFIFCLAVLLLQWKQPKSKITPGRCLLHFLSGLYLYVFLQQAYFSRVPGSRDSVNMILLGTWGATAQSRAYVIENIIMFIPMGMILALYSKILRKHAGLCVLTGFLCSVLLETVQFLTKRGHCQLDDIVMNTLGTLLGWLMIKMFKHAS